MKQVKKDLETVVKGMKALTKKVEKLQGQLAKIEKTQVVRKVKPKAKRKAKAVKKVPAPKKPAKATAPEKVLEILQGSEQAVDTRTLREKTGIDARSLQVALSRMKKQGKIKSVGKGVYAKA